MFNYYVKNSRSRIHNRHLTLTNCNKSIHSNKKTSTFTRSYSHRHPASSHSFIEGTYLNENDSELLSIEQTPYDKLVAQRNKQLSQTHEFDDSQVFTLSHNQEKQKVTALASNAISSLSSVGIK